MSTIVSSSIDIVNRNSSRALPANMPEGSMSSSYKAATITANVASNLLISEDIRSATTGVIEGKPLSDGLRKSPWIPNLLKEMIAVGEETGKLEDTLNVVNDYYTQEVAVAVQRALGILEPCIILVLAGLVVFILLSVYLPLFSMYGSM